MVADPYPAALPDCREIWERVRLGPAVSQWWVCTADALVQGYSALLLRVTQCGYREPSARERRGESQQRLLPALLKSGGRGRARVALYTVVSYS